MSTPGSKWSLARNRAHFLERAVKVKTQALLLCTEAELADQDWTAGAWGWFMIPKRLTSFISERAIDFYFLAEDNKTDHVTLRQAWAAVHFKFTLDACLAAWATVIPELSLMGTCAR